MHGLFGEVLYKCLRKLSDRVKINEIERFNGSGDIRHLWYTTKLHSTYLMKSVQVTGIRIVQHPIRSTAIILAGSS